jgi:hypothetical protein
MRIDKVILKAFISTFSAIVLLCAFMVGVLALAFPSTMMHLSYDFGQDKSSIKYAERAYNWFDDTYYMAYAMEVAIGCDNQEKIETCGEALVKDEPYFTQYCAEKQANLPATMKTRYEDYLYGKIAVAKYEQGKKEEAVEYAFASLKGGFPLDNAVAAVFYAAMNDQATVDMIKGKMNMQAPSIADGDKAYFDQMLALMGK